MIDSEPVLVVGAGPTGLAMAAFLTAHGVRPRLVDRSLDRAHESRALAIQPRTLEVLAGLGVADTLVQAGNPNVALRLHARGRSRPVPLFDRGLADTAYPYLLFLSQAETERILAEHLRQQGIEVERGVELTALTPGADLVTATLRTPGGSTEQVDARYVIGCDGAHSAVRQLAGIEFTGGAYPQTFVLADVEADGLDQGAAHVFLSGLGMLFFFPLVTPASWRVLAMRPQKQPAPADTDVSLAEVQALVDAYTEGSVRLHDPVWMTNFRLYHRAAEHYRAGRIFLAGDAAHIHSPAGAQGMNTGIQDAANLAWKLAQTLAGRADPAVLDTYDTERAPIGRMVLRMSDRAFTVATSTNPVVRFTRTRVAPALLPLSLGATKARAYLFRTVAQLNIRYRRSPLAVDGPGTGRRGPHAGDRLPDATLAYPDRKASLHELTGAPGWHLLLCGPGWDSDVAALVGDRTDLITVHRLSDAAARPAVRALGVAPDRPAVFLVRPDGHIGYRAVGSDPAPLAGYLQRWLPRRTPATETG